MLTKEQDHYDDQRRNFRAHHSFIIETTFPSTFVWLVIWNASLVIIHFNVSFRDGYADQPNELNRGAFMDSFRRGTLRAGLLNAVENALDQT